MHEHLTPPQDFAPRASQEAVPKKRSCIFFALVAILFIFLGGCTARILFSVQAPDDPSLYDPVTLEAKKPRGFISKIKHFVFRTEPELEGEHKDRINILVLGQGGPGHDGPYLTDTIILASIKPSTGQVAFTSIPRDLAVDIPNYGVGKINHVNAFAEAKKRDSGIGATTKIIKDIFDQEVHYAIRVDFTAFEEIIDDIGGVSVTVDRTFADYQYPAANHEYQTVSFTKGVQSLDGETSLQYVRSRHGNNGEGSDFARSKRQQKVILALKEKILSFETLANPLKLNGILDSVSKHVLTNMDFADMIALLKLSKELDTSEILTLTLDSGPDGYLVSGKSNRGAFILTPASGSFEQINGAIENIFEAQNKTFTDNTPTQAAPLSDYTGANLEVQNGTWRAGMASRTKGFLISKKFAVLHVGNTEERPQSKSAVYLVTEGAAAKEAAEGLASLLSIPVRTTLPAGEAASTSTDLLLILGEDYTE
ncbi:MAG: LCP family protein [Candidatus Magasanikbacteria bacterium]|nr:LCP family protein [Candidatus Magasanikbacteria bacterium]